MTARITFAGDVSPRVWLSYKTGKAAGAHPQANDAYLYELRNECVYEWQLRAVLGAGSSARTIVLTRRAGGSRGRLFDEAVGIDTYVNEAVSAADLNAIFDAQDAGTLRLYITFKIRYHHFFELLLGWMTHTGANDLNVARVTAADPIMSSFTHARSGGSLRVTWTDVDRTITDVPCILSGWDVIPRGTGAPLVKLYVYLKIKEDLSAADRDRTARILVAADHDKIERYGADRTPTWDDDPAGAASAIERCLRSWERNVFAYLINHADLTHGQFIFDQCKTAGLAAHTATPTQANVVKAARDAVDAHLVTANAWHEPRETDPGEAQQLALSEAFAYIKVNRWRASPVRIHRSLEYMTNGSTRSDGSVIPPPVPGFSGFSRTRQQEVNFILCTGAAHCGEHATVSFEVLKSMMIARAAVQTLLVRILNTSYVPIDHAFVVGGITPTQRVRATIHNPNSGTVGDPIVIWDLAAALTAAGVDGFVCDAYLATTSMAATASGLLASIRRRPAGRRCEYLGWDEMYPSAPLSLVDRTGATLPGV